MLLALKTDRESSLNYLSIRQVFRFDVDESATDLSLLAAYINAHEPTQSRNLMNNTLR